MRKQIAAANWKMNLTYQQGEQLLDDILAAGITLADHQEAVFAVPSLYLTLAQKKLSGHKHYHASAQNCYNKKSGAYTGEIAAEMIKSVGVSYCVLGHSERREYFQESHQMLAEKVDLCFENGLTPIFCCGEPLSIREQGSQNEFVATQLRESLYHLPAEKVKTLVIAYEPIWAIGTGKTATTAQAQEMHAYLRSVLADQYGQDIANTIPILYGGSVKANNAAELFASPDVDGGLVGGASLVATDFMAIIKALK